MRKPPAFARNLAVALFASGLTLAAFACGSRTGLIGEGPWETDEEDASSQDPVRRFDAQLRDVADPLPGLDARPDVVVDQRDCKDPSETLVYVISDGGDLFAYDPRDSSFRLVGPILCPSAPGETPFSMAVDRQGVAYVVFSDGELYRVSTRTAACAATPFVANQQGVSTFGMGFASNQGGPAETLFIASTEFAGNGLGTASLGRVGLPSFDLELVDEFSPTIYGAELTGTGDGRLFGFYNKESVAGTFIGQIDKSGATVIAETALPTVTFGMAWAFAFWGGDFYTFTGTGVAGTTVVTRVRPSDGTVVEVSTVSARIVGAGVSTCSPVE